MLLNPGFEIPMGDSADPDNWWGMRKDPSLVDVVMKTSTAEAHTGSQSGKTVMAAVSGGNLWAGWGQEVSVGAGKEIMVSVWLKATARIGADPTLQVEFKNMDGDLISKAYAAAPAGTFDWTKLGGVTATPLGTETVLINLLVEKDGDGSSGEFYWDDAEFDVITVPEPASLLLLGSGLIGLLGLRKK
jgi:hypothetical protein